jgi:hypothetical protein
MYDERESLRESWPELAELFAPEFHDCPAGDVEALLRQGFGVESLESFGSAFKKLRRHAERVARIVPKAFPVIGAHAALAQRALPALRNIAKGVAPLLPTAGRVAGTALGGPAGAMVGGAVGNIAGSALGASPRQAGVLGAAVPAVGAAGAVLNTPPAATQLMNVLGRPEVVQALTALAMGAMGNPSTQVGNTEVPVAAVANLIGSLAHQASEEYRIATQGAGPELPDYLADDWGQPRCDPSSPDQRAAVLYELMLTSEAAVEADEGEAEEGEADDGWPEHGWPEDDEAWEEDDASDFYDDMERGEMLANEAFEEV